MSTKPTKIPVLMELILYMGRENMGEKVYNKEKIKYRDSNTCCGVNNAGNMSRECVCGG